MTEGAPPQLVAVFSASAEQRLNGSPQSHPASRSCLICPGPRGRPVRPTTPSAARRAAIARRLAPAARSKVERRPNWKECAVSLIDLFWSLVWLGAAGAGALLAYPRWGAGGAVAGGACAAIAWFALYQRVSSCSFATSPRCCRHVSRGTANAGPIGPCAGPRGTMNCSANAVGTFSPDGSF